MNIKHIILAIVSILLLWNIVRWLKTYEYYDEGTGIFTVAHLYQVSERAYTIEVSTEEKDVVKVSADSGWYWNIEYTEWVVTDTVVDDSYSSWYMRHNIETDIKPISIYTEITKRSLRKKQLK